METYLTLAFTIVEYTMFCIIHNLSINLVCFKEAPNVTKQIAMQFTTHMLTLWFSFVYTETCSTKHTLYYRTLSFTLQQQHAT